MKELRKTKKFIFQQKDELFFKTIKNYKNPNLYARQINTE